MNNQEPDKHLLQEAFDLVVAVYDDPNNRKRLEVWRQQSPMHEQAAAKAESNWALLGQVEDISLSRFDKLKLAIQIRFERFTEMPSSIFPATGVVMMLAVATFFSFDTTLPAPAQPQSEVVQIKEVSRPEHYKTNWGQQRTVQLQDGSEVWLDWSTELSVLMTDSNRQVTLLDGKALFRVVPDAKRSFSVTSENAVATVLGTEFVVHKLADKVIEVEVLTGAVGVQGGDEQVPKRLKQGNVVRVANGELGEVRTRPLAEIGAWRDGVIVFEQRPLIEALEVLQPYTSYQLDTRYIYDASRPVSGTFLVRKGDEALQAIMQSYRLTGKVQGRNTLVLRSLAPKRSL